MMLEEPQIIPALTQTPTQAMNQVQTQAPTQAMSQVLMSQVQTQAMNQVQTQVQTQKPIPQIPIQITNYEHYVSIGFI